VSFEIPGFRNFYARSASTITPAGGVTVIPATNREATYGNTASASGAIRNETKTTYGITAHAPSAKRYEATTTTSGMGASAPSVGQSGQLVTRGTKRRFATNARMNIH
jgi:hypothetical protein